MKIAAAKDGWYYPSDAGWDYGYIEGYSLNNPKAFERIIERINEWVCKEKDI